MASLAVADKRKLISDLLSDPSYENVAIAQQMMDSNSNYGNEGRGLGVPDMNTPASSQQTLGQFFRQPQPTQPIQQAPQYDAGYAPAGRVEQAAVNTIRNNTTGAVTNLGSSIPQGPQIDMTQNAVDTPYGRGYYMKGDPTRVVIQGSGQIVDLGRDTTAERARMKENLALEKARADIEYTRGFKGQPKTAEQVGKEEAAKLIARDESLARRAATPGTPEYNRIQNARQIEEKTLLKNQNLATKESAQLGGLEKQTRGVIDRIAGLQNEPGLNQAVGVWDASTPVWTALWDVSSKANAKSKITDLQEYLQTKGLQDLRASGVAPGSVTEREWSKFARMIGNIDPTLSEKEFKKELVRIKSDSENYISELQGKRQEAAAKYGEAWPSQTEQASAAPPMIVNVSSEKMALSLPAGTKFKLPDGRTGTAR